MGTGRQLHLELLDERGNVLVGDDGALIFLHAENRLVDMNLQIALHLALAAQTPTGLDFLAREVRLLRVENLSPTLEYLHLTLSARGFTTTGTGQEDAVLVECRHERCALRNINGAVTVDFNIHIARWREIFLCHQQDYYQKEDYNQKYSDAV